MIAVVTRIGQTNLLVNGGLSRDQMEQTLSGVDQHINKLFTCQSHLAPLDADVQRERPYQLAGTIEHRSE